MNCQFIHSNKYQNSFIITYCAEVAAPCLVETIARFLLFTLYVKMNSRTFFSLLVLYFNFIGIALSQNYSSISDCDCYKTSKIGRRMAFICGNVSANYFFIAGTSSSCRNELWYEYRRPWIFSINFKDCDRPQIPDNIFDIYYNVYDLNLSSLRLRKQQLGFLTRPNNLTILKWNAGQVIPTVHRRFFIQPHCPLRFGCIFRRKSCDIVGFVIQ